MRQERNENGLKISQMYRLWVKASERAEIHFFAASHSLHLASQFLLSHASHSTAYLIATIKMS